MKNCKIIGSKIYSSSNQKSSSISKKKAMQDCKNHIANDRSGSLSPSSQLMKKTNSKEVKLSTKF